MNKPRAGYTLLEVLLATAIGVILMGGLYVAMSVQLHQAQAGRDLMEHSLLVRNLFSRIARDIRLTTMSPLPASSTSSSGSGGSGGSGASASSGSGGMASSSTASSGSSSTATSSTGTTSTTAVPYVGVQGQTNQLTLFISRLPSDVDPLAEIPVLGSDLRRIDYWIGNDGITNGLCRKEFQIATSTDALNIQELADPTSDPTLMVAEEVKSLQFQYFDGTQWQDTWDSTQPGADGVTPMGPPVAIKIIIGVPPAGTDPEQANDQNLKTYQHTVALITANGTTPAATTTGTTSSSTPSTTGN